MYLYDAVTEVNQPITILSIIDGNGSRIKMA